MQKLFQNCGEWADLMTLKIALSFNLFSYPFLIEGDKLPENRQIE